MKLTKCWVLGAEIEMVNGHRRIAEPFMVYTDEKRARDAHELVTTISGSSAVLVEAGFDGRSALAEEEKP